MTFLLNNHELSKPTFFSVIVKIYVCLGRLRCVNPLVGHWAYYGVVRVKMNTIALSRLKSQRELSFEALPQLCRLCLQTSEGSILFDIFENSQGDEKVPLCDRLRDFYSIKVGIFSYKNITIFV